MIVLYKKYISNNNIRKAEKNCFYHQYTSYHTNHDCSIVLAAFSSENLNNRPQEIYDKISVLSKHYYDLVENSIPTILSKLNELKFLDLVQTKHLDSKQF